MSVIAEFKCEICRKKRSYKVTTSEQFDSARVVCMGCRRKHPGAARIILDDEAKYRKVQPMKTLPFAV
jgi:hypothetical protein